MAWKTSIDGTPVCLQIIRENDPNSIDMQHNPAAADHILALAELAAYKAFCRMGVWERERHVYREDAVQEAALVIYQYADRGPVGAYAIAKRRLLRWIVRCIWQGKPQTKKDKREGKKMIPPRGLSLDAFASAPRFIHRHNGLPSPEAALLEKEASQTRQSCVAQMFDILYDLVAYQMGLERRRHHTALNDAEVLQLTLEGATTQTIMQELGLTEDMALQRVRYARQRLEDFAEEIGGYPQVALIYQDLAEGQREIPDARARERFARAYARERQADYQTRHDCVPGRRTVEAWKSRGRDLWNTEHRALTDRWETSSELEEAA